MLFDGVVFLRSFSVLDVLDIKQDPGHSSFNDLNRFFTASQRSVEGHVFSRVCPSGILSMMGLCPCTGLHPPRYPQYRIQRSGTGGQET